jgi:hypothetical protein
LRRFNGQDALLVQHRRASPANLATEGPRQVDVCPFDKVDERNVICRARRRKCQGRSNIGLPAALLLMNRDATASWSTQDAQRAGDLSPGGHRGSLCGRTEMVKGD